RMPCILEPERVEQWTMHDADSTDSVRSMLQPAAEGVLQMHAVDQRVGNIRNTDPKLIEPLA
ncbi:MAG: SOS response-associated peptidase family protein, partial [Planctomycetota bacterium]